MNIPLISFHIFLLQSTSVAVWLWRSLEHQTPNTHCMCVCEREKDRERDPFLRHTDCYEYMYTAEPASGFVFIKLFDTSAAEPLHLFHLRRLRLALLVRSQHESLLPWHRSSAEHGRAGGRSGKQESKRASHRRGWGEISINASITCSHAGQQKVS